MAYTDTLQIRFGYGLGPHVAGTGSGAFLSPVTDAGVEDAGVRAYPVLSFRGAMALEFRRQAAHGAARTGDQAAQARAAALRAEIRAAPTRAMGAAFARILNADAPLRERLTWFWADHFTVVGRNEAQRAGTAGYVDEAIRPHIGGRFANMLKAVCRHPAMLAYLDQHVSFGPDSRLGKRGKRGLNENFARELIELHTLGVDGSYTQRDVREAAELLTGLTLNKARAFAFNPAMAQPGAESVLGASYGSDAVASLSDIEAFLEDLARHPQTLRHVTTKLATHFVDDDAPSALVADLEATWRDTDGDLAAVTTALVTHPLSRSLPPRKIKPPMTFMASVLLALGLRGAAVGAWTRSDLVRFLESPLKAMGQPFLWPTGPDGWPEDGASWITPQGLSARINWSGWMVRLWGQQIEDPRRFLEATLHGRAGAGLRSAVSAAETRPDALMLIFASPDFNRS